MFGLVMRADPELGLLTFMPYSRKAKEHNMWCLVRVQREGWTEEIPWHSEYRSVRDYYAPAWVKS